MSRVQRTLDGLDPEVATKVARVLEAGTEPALLATLGALGRMLGAADADVRARVCAWAAGRYAAPLAD